MQQDITRGRNMVDSAFQGGQAQSGTHNAILSSEDYLSQARRTLSNIEDGFYIAPAFLDKLSIHIAKNFLDLPKIKVPLILGAPPAPDLLMLLCQRCCSPAAVQLADERSLALQQAHPCSVGHPLQGAAVLQAVANAGTTRRLPRQHWQQGRAAAGCVLAVLQHQQPQLPTAFERTAAPLGTLR